MTTVTQSRSYEAALKDGTYFRVTHFEDLDRISIELLDATYTPDTSLEVPGDSAKILTEIFTLIQNTTTKEGNN